MDLVAGEPIGTGHDDPVQRPLFQPIPQAIQARPMEGGTTLAILTEPGLRVQCLPLVVDRGSEAGNLLCNGVGQRLSLGRYTGLDSRAHTCPPSGVEAVVRV